MQVLRWVILLDNLNFSVGKLNSIYAVAIGYFTNIAIPRAGEITRCTSLNQTENIPVDKLFGTIILERAIDFIILICLVLLVLLLKFNLFVEFISTIFEEQNFNLNSIIWIVLLIIASTILAASYALLPIICQGQCQHSTSDMTLEYWVLSSHVYCVCL